MTKIDKFIAREVSLQCEFFIPFISTWRDMKLIVTEKEAIIVGDGFSQNISEAFTRLVFDWESEIKLEITNIPIGEYELIETEGIVFACKNQEKWAIHDRPCSITLVSVPTTD